MRIRQRSKVTYINKVDEIIDKMKLNSHCDDPCNILTASVKILETQLM